MSIYKEASPCHRAISGYQTMLLITEVKVPTETGRLIGLGARGLSGWVRVGLCGCGCGCGCRGLFAPASTCVMAQIAGGHCRASVPGKYYDILGHTTRMRTRSMCAVRCVGVKLLPSSLPSIALFLLLYPVYWQCWQCYGLFT